MQNDTSTNTPENLTPPPSGDPLQAEKYLRRIMELINEDKIDVAHTDLSKFNPGALQNHFRIDLAEYKVEISHSKYPNSDKDSYVMLFTNIQTLNPESPEKIILAYMHLNATQFSDFRETAFDQISRKKKQAEEKRLNDAMEPINYVLDQLSKPNLNTGSTPAIS